MNTRLSESEVERIVSTTLLQKQEGDEYASHRVIDELIGLDTYRQIMGCPDTETLAAYAEDALDLDAALDVATHEYRCPICKNDIADLRGFAEQQMAYQAGQALMPSWVTPFTGREEVCESLIAALASQERLVAVAAPAGAGKTRVLVQTAASRGNAFPDGTWYVSARNWRDENMAASEIAHIAGVPLSARNSAVEQLREFLRNKKALLLVDDLDAASASGLKNITDSAPDLGCLAAMQVPPDQLAFPSKSLPPFECDPGSVAGNEGLKMFLAHVQAIRPGTHLDENETRAAAGLCARAGGYPLGIELIAARAASESPTGILREFGEITQQAGDSPLWTVLSWTLSKLAPRERTLLTKCATFAGSFFADSAAAIGDEPEAAILLELLHEAALVQRSETGGRPRYELPAPIRDYTLATERQAVDSAERRHMAHFLQYAKVRAEQLAGPQQVEAIEEMAADRANLTAAMDRALQREEHATAGEFGLALAIYLIRHGYWQECDRRLRDARDAFEAAGDEAGERKAQLVLARLLTLRGEYSEAEALFEGLARAAATRGDSAILADARAGLGNVAQFRGQYREAEKLFEQALRAYEAADDPWGAADCWHNLGYLTWKEGDYPRAEELLNSSLLTQRQRGDRFRISTTLACLGYVAYEQGRTEEARDRFNESLKLREELGEAHAVANGLGSIGMVWLALGDPIKASYCYDRAVRKLERIGDRRDLGHAIAGQGEVALATNDLARARDRFESAREMLEDVGDSHMSAEVVGALSRVAEREGDSEQASRLRKESLLRLHRLGDQSGIAVAVYRCGRLAAERGAAEQALLLLYAARELCTQRNRREIQEVDESIAEIEIQLGQGAMVVQENSKSLTQDEVIKLALTV